MSGNNTSYTASGEKIKIQINTIKDELANRNKSPNYAVINKTLDDIETKLKILNNKYITNLNKFPNVTQNMRNEVVMKRDDILKNLKTKMETNAATKIQAATRGRINRKKANEMRAENNKLRAKITARLNAILDQIGRNNNKSPQ